MVGMDASNWQTSRQVQGIPVFLSNCFDKQTCCGKREREKEKEKSNAHNAIRLSGIRIIDSCFPFSSVFYITLDCVRAGCVVSVFLTWKILWEFGSCPASWSTLEIMCLFLSSFRINTIGARVSRILSSWRKFFRALKLLFRSVDDISCWQKS